MYVQCYYDAMTDEDSESLPLRLRGKRDVIFGNLPEIYKFHERQDRYHTLGVLAHELFVGLESHGHFVGLAHGHIIDLGLAHGHIIDLGLAHGHIVALPMEDIFIFNFCMCSVFWSSLKIIQRE